MFVMENSQPNWKKIKKYRKNYTEIIKISAIQETMPVKLVVTRNLTMWMKKIINKKTPSEKRVLVYAFKLTVVSYQKFDSVQSLELHTLATVTI